MVLVANETPRSAITATRSRYESLYWGYQRTHKTMISASKWRPSKTSSRLSSLLTEPPVHEGSVEHLPGMVRFATEPATEPSRADCRTSASTRGLQQNLLRADDSGPNAL